MGDHFVGEVVTNFYLRSGLYAFKKRKHNKKYEYSENNNEENYSGSGPRDRVGDKDGFESGEYSEDRENPYHSQNAGAEQGYQCREAGFAEAAQRARRRVHKRIGEE